MTTVHCLMASSFMIWKRRGRSGACSVGRTGAGLLTSYCDSPGD